MGGRERERETVGRPIFLAFTALRSARRVLKNRSGEQQFQTFPRNQRRHDKNISGRDEATMQGRCSFREIPVFHFRGNDEVYISAWRTDLKSLPIPRDLARSLSIKTGN